MLKEVRDGAGNGSRASLRAMNVAWARAAAIAIMAAGFAGTAFAAAQVPDFSGSWARNAFNFEAPASGPGPIINLRRVGKDASVYILGGDPIPLVGDHTDPILKPKTAEIVKRWGEWSASGHDIPDPSNQCGAFSPPFLLQMQQKVEIFQRQDHITFVYSQDDQVRRVRLNSSHPAKVTPSPMGDSIGHYEGDSLVVDTIGIRLLPHTVIDRFGTPQSEAMHVIERYRFIDVEEAKAIQERHEATAGRLGGRGGNWTFVQDEKRALQIHVTIDDPNIFTSPWTGTITYRRTGMPWEERICAENNTDILHQGFESVPTAEKPDF
jgi:hypothetical protein